MCTQEACEKNILNNKGGVEEIFYDGRSIEHKISSLCLPEGAL